MTQIWMIDTVVQALPQCTWAYKDQATSIFIECYVPAGELEAALIGTREALRQCQFEVVDIDRCMRYHEEHWDEPSEAHRNVREFVRRAREGNEVVVGQIRWVAD
jgi:hypothetical protein